MKRLRFKFGSGIRFFHCGEYGEKFARPHYHACVFNFDFDDKVLWKEERGVKLYRSDDLEGLWTAGFSTVGALTFESAAYVARYVTKKITNEVAHTDEKGRYWPSAMDYYGGRRPEYTTMSRRPGIGAGWIQQFTGDVFPVDSVVLRGKEMRPPKYYSRYFELTYPSDWLKVKFKRKREGLLTSAREPESRLSVREEHQSLRFKLLKRGYENDE